MCASKRLARVRVLRLGKRKWPSKERVYCNIIVNEYEQKGVRCVSYARLLTDYLADCGIKRRSCKCTPVAVMLGKLTSETFRFDGFAKTLGNRTLVMILFRFSFSFLFLLSSIFLHFFQSAFARHQH